MQNVDGKHVPVIGIIDAMGASDEPDLLSSAHISSRRRIGSRSFFSGRYCEMPFVITSSGWGKVSSAVATTLLLSNYHIDMVVLLGLCGSVNPSISIGDIVIGTEHVHYDFDARPLYDRYEIPLLGVSFFSSQEHAQEIAQKAVERFLLSQSQSVQAFVQDIRSSFPRWHKGLIASKDQFLNCRDKISALQQDLPEALAVDMEGASVAQVSYEYGVPFVSLKVVSDVADQTAALDFHEFVHRGSKVYSRELFNSIAHVGYELYGKHAASSKDE